MNAGKSKVMVGSSDGKVFVNYVKWCLWESKKSFYYLGDTLDRDGGVNCIATARIIHGWKKFREIIISVIQSSTARDERSSVCQLYQKQHDLWK